MTLFLVLLIGISIPLISQQRTGILTGTVVDSQSEPLPGVSVTISSPSMIAPSLSTMTNERGIFRFSNLPPGIYQMRLELQGFTSSLVERVRVNLGHTKTLSISLTQEAISEDVMVIAETPNVDIETNKLSQNFSVEELSKLPTSRDLTSIMELTPMVVVSTDFSGDQFPDRVSAGSGSRENYYSVDGTYLTDPGNGQQMIYWNYDIIEEAQVEIAGHSAEYGNAVGSVVNVITKSGGNDFSGLVNFYYRDKSLRSDNHEGTGLDAPTNAVKRQWELSFNLGGPIIKDKMWFFGSLGYIPSLTETFGFPEDADRKVRFGFGKITYRQTHHKLSLVYNYSGDDTNHMFPSQFRTPESTLNSKQWTSTINLQWDWMISGNAYAQFRGAYVDRSTTYKSNGDGPMYYEMSDGMMTNSAGFNNEQTRERIQLQGSFSYFLEGFLGGDHDIKAGFDYEYGESGYNGTSQADSEGFTAYYTYYGVPLQAIKDDPLNVISETNFKQISFYAQDTWKLWRFNFNYGFRINNSRIIVPVQEKVPEPITAMNYTNFEPRIGLTFDLSTKKNQMAVKLHYGRYYANLVALGGINPNSSGYTYYYNMGGEWVEIYAYSPSTVSVSEDLGRPYADTYIIGFDMELMRDISFSVSGIYKESKNFIGQIDVNRTPEWFEAESVDNPLTGEVILVYSLMDGAPDSELLYTNPSEAKRRYKAVQFSLRKRMSNNYMFALSYTLSQAKGTVPQSIWDYSGTASGTWNNPNNNYMNYGVLDMDRTHMIKFSGIWLAPFDISVGISYFGQSGYAYARSFLVEYDIGFGTFRGEAPGSQRTPFMHRIDMRVEKSFNLGKIRPNVFAEAYNLLNSNTAIQVGDTYGNPYYEKAMMIMPPRIFKLGLGLRF
jgi:hypothetical protein